MMVPVYQAAERGDFGPLHELLALLKRPYDEQPEMEAKYFRKVWKHRAATTRKNRQHAQKWLCPHVVLSQFSPHVSKMPHAQRPSSSLHAQHPNSSPPS